MFKHLQPLIGEYQRGYKGHNPYVSIYFFMVITKTLIINENHFK